MGSDLCNGRTSVHVDTARIRMEKAPRDAVAHGAFWDAMRAAGFEPTTSCSGGKRSIQLSYARRTLARRGVAGTAPEPLSLTAGCDRHTEQSPYSDE